MQVVLALEQNRHTEMIQQMCCQLLYRHGSGAMLLSLLAFMISLPLASAQRGSSGPQTEFLLAMRRAKGLPGLYQGFNMGLCSSVAGAGIGFATYEALTVAYRQRVGYAPTPAERGAIAGAFMGTRIHRTEVAAVWMELTAAAAR